jgi:hypothetical protein
VRDLQQEIRIVDGIARSDNLYLRLGVFLGKFDIGPVLGDGESFP